MNQNNFTILSLIVSFLGGGIVGALINWFRAERADKKERKIRFLERQIRELYGPLYYFTSQNKKLFELNEKYHNAYKEEYIAKKYSRDKSTQRTLEKETLQTIDIANKYIEKVKRNNHKIKKIVDKHCDLIDSDDFELFLLFYEHYTRLNTEIEEGKGLKTPFRIYQHIGDISFFPPQIIEKIESKFFQKKKELQGLLEK